PVPTQPCGDGPLVSFPGHQPRPLRGISVGSEPVAEVFCGHRDTPLLTHQTSQTRAGPALSREPKCGRALRQPTPHDLLLGPGQLRWSAGYRLGRQLPDATGAEGPDPTTDAGGMDIQ